MSTKSNDKSMDVSVGLGLFRFVLGGLAIVIVKFISLFGQSIVDRIIDVCSLSRSESIDIIKHHAFNAQAYICMSQSDRASQGTEGMDKPTT